jgi:hypothetical protein
MAEILKFARALEHLEYLQNAMLAWVKANENRTIHKSDPKTSQYAVWANAKPVDEALTIRAPTVWGRIDIDCAEQGSPW